MLRHISKSMWLLVVTVLICCLVYPLVVWAIGQMFFPFTANGSMVNGPDGKPVGSMLIAQPFTKDEYFWPRPSAASYDAIGIRFVDARRIELRSSRSRGKDAGPNRQVSERNQRLVSLSRRTSRRGFSKIGTRASRILWRSGPIIITSWRTGG